MVARIIINSLLIIALAAWQISFISGLAGPAGNLNLILVILIFILGFLGFNLAAWWAVGLALALEIFSFLPFGSQLVGLSLTLLIANVLLNHFFTNRSLYSFLALVLISTIIYKLIISLFFLFFAEISGGNGPSLNYFWQSLYEQLALNLVFTLLIFYLIYFLGKNLKPVFLVKGAKSR